MDCRVCGGDGYIVTEDGDGESGPHIHASLCDVCVWGQTLIARESIKEYLPQGVLVPNETDIPLIVDGIMGNWESPLESQQEVADAFTKWTAVVTATVAYLRTNVGRAETLYRIWQEKLYVANEAHSFFQAHAAALVGHEEALELARACERRIPSFR